MFKKFCILLCCVLFLGGCRKAEEEVVDTKVFEIPMKDNKYCRLEIPSNWNLQEQDGFYYWKLNDDTTVYKTEVGSYIGKVDGECYYTATSVSRNFEYGTITINSTNDMVPYIRTMLNKAELVERQVKQYRELGTSKLPSYADLPMALTNNGLYMPEGCDDVLSLSFTASNQISGSSFIGSWIMKAKLEDIKPLLHNIVTCNTSDAKLTSWFEDSNTYYAMSENKVVAAKKLTYNQWYCYVASLDNYADYVTKAMFNVVGK